MTRFPIGSRFGAVAALALFGSGVSLVGCGAEGPAAGEQGEDVGSVGLELDVGDNVKLDSVTWHITGNGVDRTGTFNVKNSNRISGLVGGIPAGAGYTITLTAHDRDNAAFTCTGSATFSVTAGATATARVHLQCSVPQGNGSVKVEGSVNACPQIEGISADTLETGVGSSVALAATTLGEDDGPAPIAFAWTATSGVFSDASAASPTFTCTAAGATTISVFVNDSECGETATLVVTCLASTEEPPVVKINEVESSGGVPGDWAELYNAGATVADISGWSFRDNDDTHTYTVPNGTTIAVGAYFVLEEAAFGFGLGGADSTRLYDRTGTLVDTYSWTAHGAPTYSRCPNGSGPFANSLSSTKGAQNDCSGVVINAAWPGTAAVQTVDGNNVFSSNLSGLTYQAATSATPAVLWAVQNGPGTLYRLINDGTIWTQDSGNDWLHGKALRYTNGTGNPDTEGVTLAELNSNAIYVSTERNNDASTISRPALLRFDVSATGTSLTATHQWELVSDLPVVGANLGPEAITWIPDSYLVANGFFDERAGHVYSPGEYANHGGGLFFVGLEANGVIYAYALDHTSSTATRVATIESGHVAMMGLEFDREVGYLWATCDDTCGNQATVLRIDTQASSPTFGRFIVRRKFERPATLSNVNHEGFAIAPESECVGGQKSVFWADDGESEGHSIRRGSIPCGTFF